MKALNSVQIQLFKQKQNPTFSFWQLLERHQKLPSPRDISPPFPVCLSNNFFFVSCSSSIKQIVAEKDIQVRNYFFQLNDVNIAVKRQKDINPFLMIVGKEQNASNYTANSTAAFFKRNFVV